MTRILGILNVTPDSFSDGGRFIRAEAAIARGIELRDAGADFVDVGGESTRPGATVITAEHEQERILPVIQGLIAAGVAVSVDTVNATTARAAVAVGARVINDVSGGLVDSEMYRVIAETGVDYIAMHWRGASDAEAVYRDVVAEVREELSARVAAITAAGVDPSRVVLDPGLGFAKTAEHNWQLLGRLDALQSLGLPVLVGASRKRFLARWGENPEDRDGATAIISALAARSGAWGVRVHNVVETRRALEVQEAWQSATTGSVTTGSATWQNGRES